jgi:hydrogenase nickel incorporation protein HypB
MCKECGCSDSSRIEEVTHAHEHAHGHSHHHHHHDGENAHDHVREHQADLAGHRHGHAHVGPRTVVIERSLLEMNDHLAMHNRQRFRDNGVFVINLMSSPGAGKTRLLERTLNDLAGSLQMAVITGDLQTDNDARRLAGRGAPVLPITTGTMCHLEADLISRVCEDLDLKSIDVLFIENVGNLVCPASFDLGEDARVVLMSVTEGEDKPLKYPPMFKSADVVLLTKIDLAAAAGFDRATALANIKGVAPQAELIELSARSGDGLNRWYRFLLEAVGRRAQARPLAMAAATT